MKIFSNFLFFTIIGVIIAPVFGAGDSTTQSEADTSYIPAKSGYQTQKEEAKKSYNKASKIFMETVEDLGKQILGDSSSIRDDPDYLYQQVRLEYNKLTKEFKIPTILASELLKRLQDTNMVIIDVRKDIEQRVSMIPGAITPDRLSRKYRNPKSVKGKTFITYCTIGYRSGLYAQELLKKKLDVLNLEGGILAWSHSKGPLIKKLAEDSTKATREVHVYDESWNLVHPDYVPKW